MYVCMYVCMHVCMYVCMYMYIHVCTCMYVYNILMLFHRCHTIDSYCIQATSLLALEKCVRQGNMDEVRD